MIWTWGRLAEGNHCQPACSRTPGSLRAILLAALAVALISASSASGADDTEAPKLTSLRFTPASIETGKGTAEVTVSFAATDDTSGVAHFEFRFVDPSGAFQQAGSAKFAPTLSATNSVRITFPRLSAPGTWTLSQVYLADAAGNTLILDSDGLRGGGFPTSLQVVSTQDTVSPKLTALDITPGRIDTSVDPADVKVNVTATDDLAGVHYVELSFVSPSGAFRRSGFAKFEPGQSVAKSITVTFPRLSEPGSWTLETLLLADAAGNTLVLDTDGLGGVAARRTLEVKSTSDTVSPSLTALRFTPEAIDTTQGPATVKVEFTATDNLSGVSLFEIAFVGPSGVDKVSGSHKFSPAHEVSDSITVTFPKSSEAGAWRVGTVMVADAAANTLLLDADEASSKAGRTLQVR
jgi:hypothetical protein